MKREYKKNPEQLAILQERRRHALRLFEIVGAGERYEDGKRGVVAEVGRIMNLSRERARQLIRQAQAMSDN